MIYPIEVLNKKFKEIEVEINRAEVVLRTNDLGEYTNERKNPDKEITLALRILRKKQKDLYDAISILDKHSIVKE